MIVAQVSGQGFQQPGLSLTVTHAIKQGLLALADDPFDLPALEILARFQCGRQRPLLQLNQRITDAGFTQGIDPHQQSAGIVLAAGQVRGIDQGMCGAVQIRLVPQNRGNGRVTQDRPDPVAEQHKAFIEAQFAVEEVQHQVLIKPHRSFEYMLHARLVPDVILADALQLIVMPAVHSAVAHMGQGETPTAHDQCADRGQQGLSTAVGLQPAVLRQQQAIQCLGDAPGFRGGVVIQCQCLQGGTSGQPTVGALADTVGDGEQVTLARRQRRGRGDQPQRILVFFARADGAGFGETQLQAHRRLRPVQRSRQPNPRWFSSDVSPRAGRTRRGRRGWRTTTVPFGSCRCFA